MATLAELAATQKSTQWEPDEDTAAKMRQAKANGWSYEAIADALAEEGHDVRRELVRRFLLGLRR